MSSSKRPTIEDVAREAGVSITTVSRYLNEHFEYMSTATKDEIAAVIARLNYRPNAMARGLKANKTRQIAVIVVNISYPFCAAVIRALSDVTAPAGFGLLVFDTRGDSKREREFLLSLRSQKVDGIVIQTNGSNNDLLREYAKDVAIVMVDRKFDIPLAQNVITDNRNASYQLTKILFETGYGQIVYVTEEATNINTREERLAGYRQACVEMRRKERVEWIDKSSPNSLAACAERIREYPPAQPFCVYTANGLIMLDLYPLLLSLGFRVPDQMGLATFDDPDWSRITSPPLTSIQQPTEEMGRLAANTILSRLQGRTPTGSVHVIPSRLQIRQSTEL